MDRNEQHETIDFVRRLAGAGGGAVGEHQTHISHVCVGRTRAWKLKRPVALPYVDFSSPEKRLEACRREVDLNRRTAPSLYVGCREIRRGPDGALTLEDTGVLVDAVVEMHIFREADLFDHLADDGLLTPALIEDLAHTIAEFHRNAAADLQGGGAARIAAVLDINDISLRRANLVSSREAEAVAAAFRRELARHSALLDRRALAGRVRRCHGDLHLNNICLVEGRPTLFDCLEFNEELATTDTVYDIAFLVMDLWHRGQFALASQAFNRYFDVADDEEGVGLLRFFMAVRAGVRTHVLARQAMSAGEAAGALRAAAHSYLDLALALLAPEMPRLVALGGFSGSGKSTVAAAIAPSVAPAPGARTLNSDRIRKAMFGVAPSERLPAAGYAPEVSIRVYDDLGRRAAGCLAAGLSVVADAVFDRSADRGALEAIAMAGRASFAGYWLSTDQSVLEARVAGRTSGPSDATVDILRAQATRDTGPMSWRPVDAGRPARDVAADILRSLTAPGPHSSAAA